MRRIGAGVVLLLCGIAIGVLIDDVSATTSSGAKAGFLIVAGRTIDSTGLEPYVAAAGDAIASAGLHRVARSAKIPSERVLEGSWPYEGFVAIEQFESMDQVLSFWHSEHFQKIKKLRDGKIEIDFVIAVEAFERTASN